MYTDLQKTAIMAQSLSGVFNDQLDLSKIESGKPQIECRVFDLRQLVERVIYLVTIAALDKNLELIIDSSTNLGRYYHSAPRYITQVLISLLRNAIKFTETGTVRLGVSRPVPGILRFEVEDTGVGIDPEEQQRLFQTDAQAHSRSTCRFVGTGHGLVIARQLVELMGGYIEVTSEPGWGSCFAFEIEAVASSYRPPSR
jgi:signal transduction histidine kinase